jgi:hypothetical protein
LPIKKRGYRTRKATTNRLRSSDTYNVRVPLWRRVALGAGLDKLDGLLPGLGMRHLWEDLENDHGNSRSGKVFACGA